MVKENKITPYTCLACGEEECEFTTTDVEVMGDSYYATLHYQCEKCGNEWDTEAEFVLKWEKRK